VHGKGDHGFVPALIGIARDRGVSAYPGDGSNRVIRRAPTGCRAPIPAGAGGSTRRHAAARSHRRAHPFRDIAAVIGRHLGLPVTAIPREEAEGHFTWMAPFALLDSPSSSTLTQKLLGWQPEHPELIADLDEGHYFTA